MLFRSIINNGAYKFHELKGTTTRVFYSGELYKALKETGYINKKHIGDEFVFNSIEVRKQVIAGLIDTGGFVYQKNGRVTISNTNKDIIDRSALILRSLGESVVITPVLLTLPSLLEITFGFTCFPLIVIVSSSVFPII